MHTPGPWTISDDGTIESKHHGLIGHLKTAGNADRRLIAAAPLMLAALQQCEAALYGLGDDYRIDSAWSNARAAIEAATKE